MGEIIECVEKAIERSPRMSVFHTKCITHFPGGAS